MCSLNIDVVGHMHIIEYLHNGEASIFEIVSCIMAAIRNMIKLETGAISEDVEKDSDGPSRINHRHSDVRKATGAMRC